MSAARPVRLALAAAFALLAAGAAASRSEAPTVLGRYSRSWFAYQAVNLAALACLLAPARWRARGAGAGLAVASTFLVTVKESVRHWPGVLAFLPAVRLLAGLALVAGEFDRHRARRPVRGLALGAGFALVTVSALDLGLFAWVKATSTIDLDFAGFRDPYDLAAVTPDDVVLVGDSFVWGQGVRAGERFGDVLERLYAAEGRRVRVYSLGVRGAGPSWYEASLARVPEGRRAGVVVVGFYPNDIAPRATPGGRAYLAAADLTWALGQSSLTARAVHDALGRLATPGLDRYHAGLVADYRRDDPTFAARWAGLTAALGRLARLARSRSGSRPLLLVIPLMVDFRDYPLSPAHDALRAAGERLGYDVLDLLPEFRAALGDGARFRAGPATTTSTPAPTPSSPRCSSAASTPAPTPPASAPRPGEAGPPHALMNRSKGSGT